MVIQIVHSHSKLQHNLKIARTVLKDFKSEFPYLHSDTFVQTKMLKHAGKNDSKSKELCHKLFRLKKKYANEVNEMRNKARDKKYPDIDEYIIEKQKLVKETNAANCDECAELIYFRLKKNNIFNNITSQTVLKKADGLNSTEELSTKFHKFNVIGLDKKARIDEPKTWGENAVIIDGWLNLSGKAKDMLEHYKVIFDINKEEVLIEEALPYFEKLKISVNIKDRIKNFLVHFYKKNT